MKGKNLEDKFFRNILEIFSSQQKKLGGFF
jgi:hypothetical protein